MPGQTPPRVVAQRLVPQRFARYARTPGYNAAINARQFGGTPETANDGGYDTFKVPAIVPDELFDDALDIAVGGLTFAVRHARGETEDQAWVWCEQRRVLCTGDLFINAAPNAGNPQKVQRYPWDWAVGLRAMRACEAASLCPGHGGPIVRDAAKVARVLDETATYLETIVERTLAVLEDGAPPHVDVVREVPLPRSESPWLRAMYDEPEFIVRTVIRWFGGWWSGRPSELKPASRKAVAREIAQLAGGARVLAARARDIAAAGDAALACHLADYALEAEPGDAQVRETVALLYDARADGEAALMSENLFRSAAAYARAGRPFR